MFELSQQQQAAASAIVKWYETARENFEAKPIFRLFGYAGTGKTTTINSIMEQLGFGSSHSALFGAYTGKAAMVMRRHGLPARTIHSLIYKPVPPDSQECNRIQQEMQSTDDAELRKKLRQDLKEAGKVHFVLRERDDSDLSRCHLLVLDECSMVNDEMLADLLSFRVPMLVLGDPGQLPPIEGEGALTREKPDAMLTEIHRQALDNPIIDFATRARNGIFIPKITLGTSAHVMANSLSSEQVLAFDQILCGKNFTRKMLNKRIRGLKEFEDIIYPEKGDKLICLKNDAENGLFNGMMCEVLERGDLLDTSVELLIRRETDNEDSKPLEVKALRAHFESYQDKEALENVKWWERTDTNEFDFGYAITVHKAQGSQWENVLLWDDKFLVWKRAERKRWLYTGITRAIEGITIAS